MSVLIFIIVLVILIFVHELGHFLAAKAAGVRVDEFGFGYPPRIISWKPARGETTYSLNALPFGGFVKILGEDADDLPPEGVEAERSMVTKPWYTKIIILAAGVLGNIILAWLLISSSLMWGLPTAVERGQPYVVDEPALTVTGVLPNSPAEDSGVMPGDTILFLENAHVSLQGDALTPESMQNFVAESAGSAVTMMLMREAERLTVTATPEEGIVSGQTAIGVSLALIGVVEVPPLFALYEGAKLTGSLLAMIVTTLSTLAADAFRGDAELGTIAGPVGIVSLVGDASSLGFIYLVSFTAYISLNLAVINLVPFPALDGGRILFVLIEKVKGSEIKPVVSRALNTVGFALLILLMLAVTYNDVIRLIGD